MTHRYLRFLTLNLGGGSEHWDSRLALVAKKLAGALPDVVALQEVCEIPGRMPNQAEILARHQGWPHVYVPAATEGEVGDGLAILSRYPIGAHDSSPLPAGPGARAPMLLSARIDSELGDVWVHTTQLSGDEDTGARREDQVVALDKIVDAHAGTNPQVVMGDFNCVPSSDETRWMCGLTTLGGRRGRYQDAWDVIHADLPGYTWARSNPSVERKHWLRADRRIDYIFVTRVLPDRRGTVHSARLIFDEPEIRASGERMFASDHFGVVAEVQFLPEPESDSV